MEIMNNIKFDNVTKRIRIYSLHSGGELLLDAVIDSDTLRESVLKAIRDAERLAFDDGINGSISAIKRLRS